MSKIYVPATGPIGAKLMILGESPDPQESNAGKLFVGGKGKELDKLLRDAGINRGDCWISAVSKYEVPPSPPKKKIPFAIRANSVGINVPEQLYDLQNEINSIKPNCILGLGSTALWALTGKTNIGNFRGSILHGMGTKLVATYNPSGLLHHTESPEFKGYWNRQVMVFDCKRALNQSQFPELSLPQRHLEICKRSAN